MLSLTLLTLGVKGGVMKLLFKMFTWSESYLLNKPRSWLTDELISKGQRLLHQSALVYLQWKASAVHMVDGGLHGVFALAAEAACCGVAGATGVAGTAGGFADGACSKDSSVAGCARFDSISVTFMDVITCTSVLSSTYNLYKV